MSDERHGRGYGTYESWYDDETDRSHSNSVFNGWQQRAREMMRDRRDGRRPCICEPGDPCDYHAALGVGSIVGDRRVLRDGEPCGLHPACLSHVTHPCEGCGRIAGRYPGAVAPVTRKG